MSILDQFVEGLANGTIAGKPASIPVQHSNEVSEDVLVFRDKLLPQIDGTTKANALSFEMNEDEAQAFRTKLYAACKAAADQGWVVKRTNSRGNVTDKVMVGTRHIKDTLYIYDKRTAAGA